MDFFMVDTLSQMFSYPFLVRAAIVGLLVSLCAALLGVSLVLKRYSMIGDGLSHVGFGTLAVATALGLAPLTVSIPVVVLAAFLLLRVSENSKIKGDAAIALISTGSLAVGVIVISMTTGMNTDVCNYLFGSILAMDKSDVYLSIALSAVVLSLFILFYNKIFAVTFDETFLRATGAKAGLFNMLIAFLTAITIVLGMRIMGAMLISTLVIFPALTAMRLCKRFKTVVICSAFLSIICFFAGLVVSYLYDTPTGASVVIINSIAFLLFSLIAYLRKIEGMRKILPSALILLLLLSGCAEGVSSVPNGTGSGDTAVSSVQSTPGAVETAEAEVADDVVEIQEKLFIAQTNDIYINAEDYLGKTIKYEGIFDSFYSEDTDTIYYYVFRYGPGCCSYDGIAGFEVLWEEDCPAPNDWVEAVGVLETHVENGLSYLQLRLRSLTVLDRRGEEYVAT